MRIQFKRIYIFLVLNIFVISTFSPSILDAARGDDTAQNQSVQSQNKDKVKNTGKDRILKDSFSGKKLDGVKDSIKEKDGYRLLVQSSDGLDTLMTSFGSGGVKVKIKQVGDHMYMVRFPLDTKDFSQEFGKIDNGIIPSQIGGYDVVEPDVVEALGTEYLTGESLDQLWWTGKIGVPSFVEDLSTKEKIKVGILDTGVDAMHPDLSTNYDAALSYDFVNDGSGGIDDNGHGTQVAGVIGAQVNGSGIFGVDPNTDLISLKVLNQDGIGTTYDVLEALAYAKEQHVPVLNISFGGLVGDPATSPICQVITDLKNNGTVTVVAAGNAGQEVTNTLPAACPDAITVGASTHDGTRASFSNYGNLVDLYAPGVDIYTTASGGGYTTKNGTSFSAPIVAGLVAKEKAFDPNLTYDQIVSDISANYGLGLNSTPVIVTSTGVAASGETLSGVTSSGLELLPPIDYSTYKYYSGTFQKDGITYGNSLYSDTMDFSGANLSQIQIYTYSGYLALLDAHSGLFQTLSVPTNGLVGEWKLDGNTNDTSGNGNNGAASNVSWTNTNFGGQSQSAHFNGTNSRVQGGSFSINGNWAFSLWVNETSNGTLYNQGVFDVGGQATLNGFGLWLGGANQPGYVRGIGWRVGNNFQNYDKVNYILALNTWYHIVMVYDGSSIKTYVNGNLIANNLYTTNPVGTNIAAVIGTRQDNGYIEGFPGNIQGVRVYNRALSTSEIQDIYNDGTGSTTTIPNTTNLPYTNSYFAANPNATYLPTSGPDNFTWNSNAWVYREGANGGVAQKTEKNNGDPVHLATGEFTYDNTLMSVPGVGLPYELKVEYKSQADYNGPLGFNWDHNYNQYLSGETNGNILYYNGQLGTFRFIKSGSVFLRNEGLRATLVQSGSTYTIQYEDGNTTTFNTSNRLSQIRDIHGNALNFTYSGAYLSGVTDTLGHTSVYSYYDHNRLKAVTDFSGRKVDFVYYTGASASGNTYDLQSVTLTNATGATKTIGFEYSTNSSGALAHNLTRLIDAKGQIYVTNTYDTGDHVATQKYGTGTLTYAYTLSGTAITKNTVIDRLGHKTEYSYDASGNNTSIKYYSPGETSSLTYAYEYSGGLITKEARPRGNGYKYTYDGSGNLIEKRLKSDINGSDYVGVILKLYSYNSRNELLSESLPDGKTINYTRDGQGNITTKATSSTSATGYMTTIATNSTYLSNGLLATETSPEGKLTRYAYSGGQVATLARGNGGETSTGTFATTAYGRILTATDGDGYTKTSSYTPWDLVATGTTSEGIVTGYAYDANNNKIRETRYLSGGVSMDSYYYYDDLDHLTGSLVEMSEGQTVLTSYTYDANGNIKTKKIGNGATVTYTYNEFAKPTEERIIMVPGDSSKDIVTSYVYDSNNNLTSKTDPRGYTTTYTYDLYDRLVRVTQPDGSYALTAYNADSTVDATTMYTSTGVILSKTHTIYDGLTHPVKTISYLDPANNTGAVETSIIYTKDFETKQTIDAKNNTTTYAYDTRGNQTSVTDPLGNQQTTTYNKRDLKTSTTTTPTSGSVTTTSYTYDHDGRLTASTNTAGKSQTLTYNQLNQVTSTTDEMNRLTTYTRDYRGLPLTKTEYLSGQTNPSTTTMVYDDRANLITVTDPESHTTTYEYDGINRNTKVIYPDTTTTTYVYDKSGNLTTKTDANATTTTNSYDNRNRLTSKTISTGSGVIGTTSESYTYDQLSRLTSGTNSQSGTQISNLALIYDPLSRLASESQTASGQTKTVGYIYDNNSNLTTLTHPDGQIQSFTYDVLNRNTTVGYSGTTVANYGYSGLTLANLTYNNSRTTNYTYDSLQRLTGINPNTASISTESLTYDDSSIITSDGTKTYNYDGLKRLISATPTASGNIESYTYDKTGNRKTDASSTYTTNTLDQYTSQTGGVNKNYTYDANGNLKSDGTKTYVYDYNNRLVQVTQSGATLAQYQYDILGRRIQKVTPTEATIYLYAGDNIVQELKTTGGLVLKKEYINGIGTDNILAYDSEESTNQDKITFCQVRVLPYSSEFTTYGYSSIIADCNATIGSSTGVTTKRYFYHVNHLGSAIGISDNSGNVLQAYTYDTFGKAYVVSGSGTLTSIDSVSNLYGNTRLFTGREYDREVGLYFNRARYYDPQTGRFISRDPIGQKDQINLYTYVANSPLIHTDIFGREKQLLEDIKNGNIFTVSLVGRSLNPDTLKSLGFLGTHTFIMIDSKNKKGITRTYRISGQPTVDGKLIGVFNDPGDTIHWDGVFGGGSVKQVVDIATPTGMTDGQFVQNIYNGYIDYNTYHQVDYNLFSKPFWGNSSGNCNNFSATILMGASGDGGSITQEQINTLNSPEADFGMGEPLY